MKLSAQNYRRINLKMFFHENHPILEMKRTKEKLQNPSKYEEKEIM